MRSAILLTVLACHSPSSKTTSASGAPPDAHVLFQRSDQGLEGLGALSGMLDNLDKPGHYDDPSRGATYDEDAPHTLVLRWADTVTEAPSGGWGGSGESLRERMRQLRRAGDNQLIEQILIRFGDLDLSLPDALELRRAMRELKTAGKKFACHAETLGNLTYLLLSTCDQAALAPAGIALVPGPALTPVYLRGLFDKLGVVPDFMHVGNYKTGPEPFTHAAPSREAKEVYQQILTNAHDALAGAVAENRSVTVEKAKQWLDAALWPAEAAKSAGLIDAVAPYEGFRESVSGGRWRKAKSNTTRGMGDLMQFLGAVPTPRPPSKHVALVYAVGSVVDGRGEGAIGAAQEIASGTLVPALRAIAADEHVAAVVLRIDSGGGSALASEQIWQAVAALRAQKPVVVSMSDVAASGGYYIAAPATTIFAEPTTLTGSIGVFGGKLAIAPALESIGVRSYPMGPGKRAGLVASLGAWSAEERATIQQHMQATYDLFLTRVAAGRKMTVEAVHAVAQGHVWTGDAAKARGLVDQLGGLDAALAAARKLGNVTTEEIDVYPPKPTLRDFLESFDGLDSLLGATAKWPTLAGLAGWDVRLLDALPTEVKQLLRDIDAHGAGGLYPIQARANLPTVSW